MCSVSELTDLCIVRNVSWNAVLEDSSPEGIASSYSPDAQPLEEPYKIITPQCSLASICAEAEDTIYECVQLDCSMCTRMERVHFQSDKPLQEMLP